MRIVVTGAAGFVGRPLVAALGSAHRVVAIDREPFEAGTAEVIVGDFGDQRVLSRAFAAGCDAVIHLASVPGGAAERDPAIARAVNVDATLSLIETAAAAGQRPRFLFASSIAVFGEPLPALVDDSTPVAPRMLYGAHKAMVELWIDARTRRGEIDGLSLRLPGVVARPRGAAGHKSAFMSDLFHALRAHEAFVAPVSARATLWLMPLAAVVAGFLHALGRPGLTGAINLHATRMSVAELAGEVIAQAHSDGSIRYEPDAQLEAAFGSLPPMRAQRADAEGFPHEPSVAGLVAAVLSGLQ